MDLFEKLDEQGTSKTIANMTSNIVQDIIDREVNELIDLPLEEFLERFRSLGANQEKSLKDFLIVNAVFQVLKESSLR